MKEKTCQAFCCFGVQSPSAIRGVDTQSTAPSASAPTRASFCVPSRTRNDRPPADAAGCAPATSPPAPGSNAVTRQRQAAPGWTTARWLPSGVRRPIRLEAVNGFRSLLSCSAVARPGSAPAVRSRKSACVARPWKGSSSPRGLGLEGDDGGKEIGHGAIQFSTRRSATR